MLNSTQRAWPLRNININSWSSYNSQLCKWTNYITFNCKSSAHKALTGESGQACVTSVLTMRPLAKYASINLLCCVIRKQKSFLSANIMQIHSRCLGHIFDPILHFCTFTNNLRGAGSFCIEISWNFTNRCFFSLTNGIVGFSTHLKSCCICNRIHIVSLYSWSPPW